MSRRLRTRRLSDRPDLEQLKRQAKELLRAFHAQDADTISEIDAHYHGANPSTFALHDAQLVLARAYGFDSWPKLKAFVDGATVQRLIAAVRAADDDVVERLLRVRPELARMSHANLGVIHHAVLAPAPAIVRRLMVHGADARCGIYPHREATTAYAIAVQRGYTEIVRIIEDEEQRRREERGGTAAPPADDLFRAIQSGDHHAVTRLLDANPAVVNSRHSTFDVTPLHIAARALDPAVCRMLLDRGADVSVRGHEDLTPLDVAAQAWYRVDHNRLVEIATLLLERGAALTPPAAVALGEIDWLRARSADGSLTREVAASGGLLRIAATHNQSRVLQQLLDWGFDPDERIRVGDDDASESWGMALQHCAGSGKYELAEMLLKAGADANARIMASGDPMFSAYSEKDWTMVALLERYGGILNATSAGLFRQTDLARRMLSGEFPYRLDGVGGDTLAEQLLWGGACGGDPDIVRMALERVDWPRDDPRWFTVLEQPLRTWTHGSGSDDWPRDTYVTCFRLVLARADPNLRGRPNDEGQFGLTILHSVAAKELNSDERLAFASAVLDAGARLDIRDNVLKSTPLGWASRWGRVDLVDLLLDRGADPVESDAEPWATPRAWAERMNHPDVLARLRR